MAHSCSFVVWKKSMSLRYVIETTIFFLVLLLFQFEVSLFNKDLHMSMREMELFETFSQEITSKGGKPFDPANPDANKHLLESRHLVGEEINDTFYDDKDFTSSWPNYHTSNDQNFQSKVQRSHGRNLAYKIEDNVDRSDWTVT